MQNYFFLFFNYHRKDQMKWPFSIMDIMLDSHSMQHQNPIQTEFNIMLVMIVIKALIKDIMTMMLKSTQKIMLNFGSHFLKQLQKYAISLIFLYCFPCLYSKNLRISYVQYYLNLCQDWIKYLSQVLEGGSTVFCFTEDIRPKLNSRPF